MSNKQRIARSKKTAPACVWTSEKLRKRALNAEMPTRFHTDADGLIFRQDHHFI
jgi:hypothetical protein